MRSETYPWGKKSNNPGVRATKGFTDDEKYI
jgi:hypothetical protein